MKRLYTLLLAASLTAASAMATVVTPSRQIDASKLGQPQSWKEVTKTWSATATAKHSIALPASPRRAASRAATEAPSSAEELAAKQWDATYLGMLSSNTGNHEGSASFTVADDELYLALPDYSTSFYVGYENSSLTVYGSVSYGTNSQGYLVVLCPVHASTGAMLTDDDVSVPFNPETGEFEFPSTFAWALCAVDPSDGSLKGYFWAAKSFTLCSPDGDYSINATTKSEMSNDNKFTFTVNPGADAASVKMMVMPYDVDTSTYASYIASMGTECTAGTEITVDPVNNHVLASQGAMSESGYATVLFASYDADGNLKKTERLSFIVVLENEEGWRNVGNVTYTDQLFAQYYQNTSHSQQAMLQQSKETPGMYRFVNPYSEMHDFTGESDRCYFIFDTTDPEWVSVPFGSTGVDLGGDGILTFGTCAALGYDKTNGTAQGLTSGTIVGQTVTFPVKSMFAREQYYNTPGSWTYVNSESAVTFTLPDITLTVTVVNADNEPVADATVKVGEETLTTDANGTATCTVPFETGYFGQVTMTVDSDEATTVNLNGANTAVTYTVGQGTEGGEDPEPGDETWTALEGKGTWSDGFFTDPSWGEIALTDSRWEVTIEQSDKTPGRYRILPYATGTTGAELLGLADNDHYFVINATNPQQVWVEGTWTPFETTSYEHVCVENGWDGSLYGTLENGVFSFPANSFYEDYYGYGEWEPANTKGLFAVALPGVKLNDYMFFTTSELCADETGNTEILFTAGADIASVKALTVAGFAQAEDFTDKFATEGTEVDLTAESATFKAESGLNTTMFAAYDAEGNVKATSTVFHYNNTTDETFKPVEGKLAKFTDATYTPLMDIESEETTCAIEESTVTPGRYRLVEPYSESEDFDDMHSEAHTHYMYIDASNPAYVVLEPSVLSVYVPFYGNIMAMSASVTLEYLGYTPAEISAANLAGTMTDNTITFPGGSVQVAFTEYEPGSPFMSSKAPAFTIEIVDDPEYDSIKEISADNEAEAVYFNLHGQRIAKPTVPGIYIRNNAKVFVR